MIARRQIAHFEDPLTLAGGEELPELDIAYETYGRRSPDAGNVILVCHGLTADSHAAGRYSADDAKPGWWDAAIGPGKTIDTDRHFVVCSNVLGGCGGSTGPATPDPRTGRPYGTSFPVVTIADMVEAQRRLLESLGIRKLDAVVGGCMGGFQALEWVRRYPRRVRRAVVIGATAATSAHTLALWRLLRRAIMSDPDWNQGDYYESKGPGRGLGLAMTFGLLIWMGRDRLQSRFERRLADRDDFSYSFDADFAVESFFESVEASADHRFDANSLLYLTRAMDYFDLARGYPSLQEALKSVLAEVLLVSYEQDWRYPPAEMESLRAALAANGVSVEHVTLTSDFGHGAFLYDAASLSPTVDRFLNRPMATVSVA